jgi:hypothetical protein
MLRIVLASWPWMQTPPTASAGVLSTRQAALAGVFGAGATFTPRTVYLTPAQVDSVRAWAHAPFDTPRLTYWVASRNDTLLGRGFLDTHTVRTMPATLLVAVGTDRRLLAVTLLAFHEPEDYAPPRRWFERFAGRALSKQLRPGGEVDAVAGATITSRTFTEAVRRSLALAALLPESGR